MRASDQISDIVELEVVSWLETGVISISRHTIGLQTQQLVGYFLREDVDAATEVRMRYNPLFKDLFCMTYPIPETLKVHSC